MTEPTWDALDAALRPPRVLCRRLSASGGTLASAVEPPRRLHGASGCLAWWQDGDFPGWHCQLPSAVSAQPQDVDPVLVSIPLLGGAIPTADAAPANTPQPGRNVAWPRGFATALPIPSSVSKSPGLVTPERSKDLPQGCASSSKALSLLLLATSPATAGKLMQEWLVLKQDKGSWNFFFGV